MSTPATLENAAGPPALPAPLCPAAHPNDSVRWSFAAVRLPRCELPPPSHLESLPCHHLASDVFTSRLLNKVHPNKMSRRLGIVAGLPHGSPRDRFSNQQIGAICGQKKSRSRAPPPFHQNKIQNSCHLLHFPILPTGPLRPTFKQPIDNDRVAKNQKISGELNRPAPFCKNDKITAGNCWKTPEMTKSPHF